MVKIRRAIIWGIIALLLTLGICNMAAEYRNDFNDLTKKVERNYRYLDKELEGI